MKTNFYSLHTLQSVETEDLQLFRQLGISNLGDLLAYQPYRYAGFVRAAQEKMLNREEVMPYLDEAVQGEDLHRLLSLPVEALKGIGAQSARILKKLEITTIADLVNYPVFQEAEEIITRAVSDEDDPYAPACVLPTCKKYTRNSKSYVSFFKQQEIRTLSVRLNNSSSPSQITNLFHFFPNDTKVLYLGYAVSYLQDWIYTGVHLGEPQGSVSLFMGQDTQVSVLDWKRINSAIRREDTRLTERLSNTLIHQRAVDEVARATAEEHQYGATSAFGANAATAGSFVAAGAVIGGVGGGITGLVLGNVANAAGGTPTLAGALVGSVAGAAAGSLVFSGATALGFVETDAEGAREIYASSAQNIQQRTAQNASSLRSFWSSIVSQNVQEEEQRIRTDRVTNHNRIHALNALYFEVLNGYQVNISSKDSMPILFLPFKPILFNKDVLRRYWWIIRTYLTDESLVLALDQYFLTLSSAPSPATAVVELPRYEDVRASKIEVKLLIKGWVPNYDEAKRKKIEVTLVTSTGVRKLTRTDSSAGTTTDTYIYNESIALHTIEEVKIENTNDGAWIEGIDTNAVEYRRANAKVTLRNKAVLEAFLPQIGSLEIERNVREDFVVATANIVTIPWNIANRLRDQFEGIDTQAAELVEAEAEEELVEAKLTNLLNFLNANKYGFTRLILQSTESEQMISALEQVEVGGVELSKLASTTPLGFCGNHVVLALKKGPQADANYDTIGFNTIQLVFNLEQFNELDFSNPQELRTYGNELLSYLKLFLSQVENQGNGSVREQQLVTQVRLLRQKLEQVVTFVENAPNWGGSGLPPIVRSQLLQLRWQIGMIIKDILNLIQASQQTNSSDVGQLLSYYSSVKQSLANKMGKIISSNEVSLPSPAVFMEPVLSNAKGAELYDMRRNSHYEILPAPGIGDADPNTIRVLDVQLSPNMPPATLAIQNAPNYPLPNSINAAIAEAGKLDLSTLITSNAGTLNTTLSNLASMATELAKASAQLTGDAQKEALTSAGKVAEQIAEIVTKSMQAPSAASPAAKPEPPKGQQSKAEVVRELDRINKGGGTEEEKKEMKETIGAPVAADGTRDFERSVSTVTSLSGGSELLEFGDDLSAPILAQRILNNNNITLATAHASGVNDNATAEQNILDTSAGLEAARSDYGNAPGGTVGLDSEMLRGLLDLAEVFQFSVSELAGGSHSRTSRHYAGVAADINIINNSRVSSNHPDIVEFMEAARSFGATEVLGPGDPNHDTHIHIAWPRPTFGPAQ
jgi:hypothetical protein